MIGPWTCFAFPECTHYAAQQPCFLFFAFFFFNKKLQPEALIYILSFLAGTERDLFQSFFKQNWLTLHTYCLSPLSLTLTPQDL